MDRQHSTGLGPSIAHSSTERPLGVLRRRIYNIIFETDTFWGRFFDMTLLATIVLSILLVVLESDKNIRVLAQGFFDFFEWVFTILFTVEYILRLYSAKVPLRYAKSFFGLVDFISIVPTYASFMFPEAQYIKVIRVLRLLRIFRILKLVRFIEVSQVLYKALWFSRHKIMISFGVILSLALMIGTCMYVIEGEKSGFSSIGRGMYWAIVTVTTVGYGDIVPQTFMGRLVSSVVMLLGYAIIAVPTGMVTREIFEARKRVKKKQCVNCSSELLDEALYCHICAHRCSPEETPQNGSS